MATRRREAVPEVALAGVSQPIQMRTNELIAGVRSDAAAQIYGPDLDRAAGARRAGVAAALGGPRRRRLRASSRAAGLTYLRIRPDRARLARYGLTVDDVNIVTETMAVGRRGRHGVREGPPLRAGRPKTRRRSRATWTCPRAARSSRRSGQIVPLGDVADVALERGPALVNRDNQSRRFSVEFNVRGRDVVSAVEERARGGRAGGRLPDRLPHRVGRPVPSYFAAAARALACRRAAGARADRLPALARPSERCSPPLLVFANVPVRGVGGVLALLAARHPVQHLGGRRLHRALRRRRLNGLVLVSFCLHLQAGGARQARRSREAAELRLRPVLMTRWWPRSASCRWRSRTRPAARFSARSRPWSSAGSTATLLTLLLFPAVYALAYRRKEDGSIPTGAAPD